VVSTVVSSATVGVKAAGVSNPQRLLVHLNQVANALVGPNLSTRIVPTPPTSDFYKMNLSAGDRVSLALSNLSPGNVDVKLIDTDGTTVLAGGVGSPTNLNEAIQNYAVLNSGIYFASVSGDVGVSYSLVVARNAAFDAESNNTFEAAQSIAGTKGVLGAIELSSASDWYSFDINSVGFQILLETSTPADGIGNIVNSLNPKIELYSPSNALLASGSVLADGRNESIQVNASVVGSYRVRVTNDSGSLGEYFLGVKTDNTAPAVVNRQVFYNWSTSSVFGNGSGNPLNAIDATKVTLLPGQTTSTANYTNYSLSLNGLLVDIENLPATLSVSDFQFATWDGINAAGFTSIAVAQTVSVIAGGGLNGSSTDE